MPQVPKKNSENQQGNSNRPKAVYKLTGMGIKMGVVIYLGIFLGQKVDSSLDLAIPWFTLLGSLLGVGLALYFVIKDVKSL